MPYFPSHLKKALTRILEYPLTLIEADSGCGKSTAVQACFLPIIAKDYRQYIYTSLGASAEKSWKGICELLGNVDPQAAHYLEAMGVPDRDTMSEVAYQISNLICDSPTVLCFDNFQLMNFPERKRLIQALSLHRCENLHFVILTQPERQPEQGLSFFSPGIFHIGADVLMFSKEDVRAFFQGEGIQLSPNNLDQVWQMTEGLAAAVTLQLESWKCCGRFESSEKISDLMETALWNHLKTHEQRCLVKLSVLDSFTLFQALLIDDGGMSQSQMKELFRKTNFIRFEGTRRFYHFHFLLRTFLNEKFNLLNHSEQTQILRLAARACAEINSNIQAAILYGRVKDYDALLSLMFSTHDWIELISLEKGEILEELISPLYCEKLLEYPELVVLFSFELFIRGNVTLHRRYMEILHRIMEREECYEPRRFQRLQGEYALIQSFLAFNDVEKMHVYHKEAVSLLQGPTRLLTRHGCWTFGSPSITSLYWREPGKLKTQVDAVQNSMPTYYSLTSGNGSGGPKALAAEVFLLQGEEKKASELFQQAIYEAEQFEQVCVCYCVRFGMARLALLQGNGASFIHMREKINDMAYEGRESFRVITTTLCKAYFQMQLGLYEQIPAWVCSDAALRRRAFVFALPFAHIISGRLLLRKYLKGKVSSEEFEERMLRYIQECERVQMLFPKVYYKIYLSICREYAGKTKAAVDTFREVLEMVSSDSVWLPLAEHYEELQPIINKMTVHREETPMLKRIEELGKRYRKGVQKIQVQFRPKDTVLTPREKEVADLLKQRYSVKEIAEKLVISPSTVSNTMQKIYSKLGVHSKKELYVKGPNEERESFDMKP